MTVIACIFLYPIRFYVFVDYSVDLRLCYRSERSNSVFFITTIGMSSEFRVCSKYFILGQGCCSISEVFNIVSRGADKC